ncbi:MAG TPA: radical SAM protein [Verrucomicrobiae bacterium]|nr:radical SAM protein [Verrucomicrobiae bacterium]
MARAHIIPVFLPHWGCPYRCVYCDQHKISAQNQFVNVEAEIEQALNRVSPGAAPIEVAFYGGTFTALPLELQEDMLAIVGKFIKNGKVNSVRISTHPACISVASLEILKAGGGTTVELGVQSMNREVLRLAGREYGPETVWQAVEKLRSFDFQVGIQLMPGLPGDTLELTLETVKQVIELKPEFVRVYPTVVIAGTKLAEAWSKGMYRPLDLYEAVDWCKEISKAFQAAGIPIIRMGLHASDILEGQLLAGPNHPAFKALVDSALALEIIEQQLHGTGHNLQIYCHPSDIPVVRGHKNFNVHKLKKQFGCGTVTLIPDRGMVRGSYHAELNV